MEYVHLFSIVDTSVFFYVLLVRSENLPYDKNKSMLHFMKEVHSDLVIWMRHTITLLTVLELYTSPEIM
jgi:hypothetical protein